MLFGFTVSLSVKSYIVRLRARVTYAKDCIWHIWWASVGLRYLQVDHDHPPIPPPRVLAQAFSHVPRQRHK